MKRLRSILALGTLILIAGIILGGCGGDSSEYLKANVTKLGISYSFEYPPSYTKLTPDAFEDNGREPSVSLLYTEPGSTKEKADIQMYVIPFAPIAGRPDAVAWAEEHLKILEQGDNYFKLIEQTTIQVDGKNGEMIVYRSSVLGNYLNSSKLICRDIYIDYQLYIWKISVLAVEEMGDEAEPVFEHLIETFKFQS